jgi:hypothetical protein
MAVNTEDPSISACNRACSSTRDRASGNSSEAGWYDWNNGASMWIEQGTRIERDTIDQIVFSKKLVKNLVTHGLHERVVFVLT